MFRNTTYSSVQRADSKFKLMTVSWLWTMSELSCIMEEKIPATEVFLGFQPGEQSKMWHSNPFNWLVLKDMKVLQTPVSQPLHCRLQMYQTCEVNSRGWLGKTPSDLVRVWIWVGHGHGVDRRQRLRWGQMRLELEGSACFTRAQINSFTLLLIKSKGDFLEIYLGT